MKPAVSKPKKKKDKLLNSKLITQVLMMHALADTIQFYSIDCDRKDIYEQAGLIRQKADKYGDSFAMLGDILNQRISSMKYNKRQMLDTLCFVIYIQGKKTAEMYKLVDESREYLQLPIAHKIYQLSLPCFVSIPLIEEINKIILQMRNEINDSFK